MTDKLTEALERIIATGREHRDHIGILPRAMMTIAAEALAAHRSQQEAAKEPIGWQVWWGLGTMRPHWPPFKTRSDAETHASMIKSNTEVRPLYTRATAPSESEALQFAIDALDEIALAGMSGSGQESEEGLRDWHARRAWQFISIAARAKDKIAALSASNQNGGE